MGPQATAAKLSIDVSTASRITQTFFDHFRQIRAWIQQIKRYAPCHLISLAPVVFRVTFLGFINRIVCVFHVSAKPSSTGWCVL